MVAKKNSGSRARKAKAQADSDMLNAKYGSSRKRSTPSAKKSKVRK